MISENDDVTTTPGRDTDLQELFDVAARVIERAVASLSPRAQASVAHALVTGAGRLRIVLTTTGGDPDLTVELAGEANTMPLARLAFTDRPADAAQLN